MNRQGVVTEIAGRTGLTKAQSENALKAFLTILGEEEVDIKGYIKTTIKDVEAKTYRNPSTGESVEKPATKKLAVKIGSILKHQVAEL